MYQTIEFNRLLNLVPFATEYRLENAIVDIVKKNNVQVSYLFCTIIIMIIIIIIITMIIFVLAIQVPS